MSGLTASGPDAPQTCWVAEHRVISLGGVQRRMRMVRCATGWLVSVDGPDGPTLGADRSPYLATARALAPLGLEMADAMALVGPLG
jgi:hypothetical protein